VNNQKGVHAGAFLVVKNNVLNKSGTGEWHHFKTHNYKDLKAPLRLHKASKLKKQNKQLPDIGYQ
jgi:hypothetical protein